jgi:hypothetical protein
MLEEYLERALAYFWEEPARLLNLAKTVFAIGALDLLTGAMGHVAVVADVAGQHLFPHPAGDRTLAEIYPSLVTWWVPETIVGCIPGIVLVAVGWRLAVFARQLKQAYF